MASSRPSRLTLDEVTVLLGRRMVGVDGESVTVEPDLTLPGHPEGSRSATWLESELPAAPPWSFRRGAGGRATRPLRSKGRAGAAGTPSVSRTGSSSSFAGLSASPPSAAARASSRNRERRTLPTTRRPRGSQAIEAEADRPSRGRSVTERRRNVPKTCPHHRCPMRGPGEGLCIQALCASVLAGVRSGTSFSRRWSTVSRRPTENRPFAGGSSTQKSPLTDSNRRPPPYHGGFGVTTVVGGNALAKPFSLHSPLCRTRHHLSRTPLSCPQHPGICPQNPSPTRAGPSRW